MNKYLKEAAMWAMIALPFVYIGMIWKTLPETVPIHFNLRGEPDDWAGKSSLLLLPGILGISVYLLMLVIPYLDPKKRLGDMGSKYDTLRLLMSFFIAVLSMYVIYTSSQGSINPNMLTALIGGFFALLGNYFQTIRPNYFVGLRTPWTLENEEVWKRVHRLGGRLWMAGGLMIIITSFLITSFLALAITFGSLMMIMVVVPVVFSYTEYQKHRNVASRTTE